MKLILKENIETLGHIGDVVKVAPGYARNYLLPKGLAVEATDKNAKALEHNKRQLAYKKNKVPEAAKNLLAKLEGLTVTLAHKVGAEEKLFGSVTNIEIAAFLKQNGFDIDRKIIVVKDTVKEVGQYKAIIKLHKEVSVEIPFEVVAEEA